MMKTRTQLILAICLGLVSLVAGLFAHLALTDIYHQEVNVALEWHIIQVAAFIIIVYIGFSLWMFLKILKLNTGKHV